MKPEVHPTCITQSTTLFQVQSPLHILAMQATAQGANGREDTDGPTLSQLTIEEASMPTIQRTQPVYATAHCFPTPFLQHYSHQTVFGRPRPGIHAERPHGTSKTSAQEIPRQWFMCAPLPHVPVFFLVLGTTSFKHI